jgi:drug/metabolite transporter (DMT)-like permease
VAIAIVAALAAGACFALGGVLQQRAASTRPEGESLSFRLIVDLATEPMWLLGIGFAICSYGLEALALSFGPLVLVQPLIVTELLFALPMSVRWAGSHMTTRDWLGTLAVGGGLTLGLVCASPGAGRPAAPVGQWGLALGIAAGLAALAVLAGRHERGSVARPSLYALAAALVLGCQAALLKATIPRFELGFVVALESWEIWAMAAAAILGLLLVQSAYQSGPLAATMPVVDAVDPAVAIAFGVTLFHEQIRTGPYLVGVIVGLLGLLAGIWLLDTSPTVQCLQRWQNHSDPAGGPQPKQPGAYGRAS